MSVFSLVASFSLQDWQCRHDSALVKAPAFWNDNKSSFLLSSHYVPGTVLSISLFNPQINLMRQGLL